MSSLNVIGFFALAQGKRIATLLPGATFPIHHNHYTYPSATLRVYSGSGDAPLPDNTIAFVIAKACAPTGKPIELDALYLSAFPGDPNDDQYDEHIPECPAFIHGVGHVPANHTPQVLNDGTKVFTLCVYPATRRWANVPLPRAQSCTQFLGMCNGFSDSALLQIALEHVTLSLGPHSLAQPATNSSNDSVASASTPNKRRKYIATGSTSTPKPAAAPSATSAVDVAGPSSFPAVELHPLSSFTPPQAGPSSSGVVHETRSKKLKRTASNTSLSPAPEDDEIEDAADETPVKGKGKKKAKQ
ncbi:hypothetical protein B0H13DRAFT_1879318 [Mycena leptocephala]|nr:hypothetical protein B0H13DRAFT_1879318 [Mycena leptocephala]